MKKFVLIILAVLLFISGCEKNQVIPQEEIPLPSASEVETTPTPEATPRYQMPQLPDIDFTDMTFFEDGYEIVEYRSISDGDTATFVVSGMPMSCRFLAIDTPEMNSSTYGMEPWAMAAKEFTQNKLKNAETIIMEMDEESDIFDDYDRVLAWVWVDGELLNYLLVEEGLASVKYLYGDYRYTTTFIRLESATQKTKIKIWGEQDPDYDYFGETVSGDIAAIREQTKGGSVLAEGVVTNTIDKNAFIQDESGAIYIYANKYNYTALERGNRIRLEGKVVEYNGLLEISSIVDKKITLLEEGVIIEPEMITIDMISEDIEGLYVRINGLTVTRVESSEEARGYDVVVTDGTNQGIIRVDKYLKPYPEPSEFEVGDTFDIIGNVGQYLENYQIMIGSMDDVLR